jgi:hypothetical protein
MNGGRDAWSFVEEFHLPFAAEVDHARSWARTEAFISTWRALVHRELARLRPVLRRWDDLLSDIDGDPLHEDWAAFRPLRRSREEDWSDWLAWLIASSTTGRLARSLFARDADDHVSPAVDREVSASRDGSTWRLDLRVRWRSGEYSHVEVKVGDTEFAKTFDTADVHRQHVTAARWSDWILLPEDHVEDWTKLAASVRTPAAPTVGVITWRQVAGALRRCLAANSGEPITWRVWARAFTGCIEQELLRLPSMGPGAPMIDERLADVVPYLEGCLDDR